MTTVTFRPTAEQGQALDAFGTGGSLVIEAGAGSGKTSTLRLLGESRPRARGLYIAYNKAIQLDAEKVFPRNVLCKTAHSVAFDTHGIPMKHRIGGKRVPVWEVAKLLDIEDLSVGGVILRANTLAGIVMKTVQNYCHTADRTIGVTHVHLPVGLETAPVKELDLFRNLIAAIASTAWSDLCRTSGRLKFEHDHYLKQWSLSDPVLPYGFLLFDEAQDADPCIASVVKNQMTHSQVVMVGDAAQAIYGWRGAMDIMSTTKVDARTRLTQSFRFGNAIADRANLWLDEIGTGMQLTGNPSRDSHVETLRYPDAILCRTNARTIQEVLTAHEENLVPVLVGGGTELKKLAEAAQQLQAGQRTTHPELVAFRTWQELQDYVREDPSGSDLSMAIRLIEDYGPMKVIAALALCQGKEEDADVVISTAHKSKGREWASVRIATDFKEPPIDPMTGQHKPIPRADAMLAYVSVTRAMYDLDDEGLDWFRNPTPARVRWSEDLPW